MSRRTARHGLVLPALVTALALAACSAADTAADADVTTGGAFGTGGTGDAAETPELLPGQICVPGTVLSCEPEGSKLARVCNASGTADKVMECVTADGGPSKCVNSACTQCFPGTFRCQGEDKVEVCDDDGSNWKLHMSCNAAVSGQVCTGKTCENLCDLNVKASSYIGCDYWAVDLDNAFVPGGGQQGFLDAGGAQFAVVVANPVTSPSPASVDIWWHENGVEQKVPFDSQGTPLDSSPLEPGALRVYELPRRDVNGTVQAPLAYRVTSSVPVIAYQFNPLTNEEVYSNDASMLIPAPLVGREYFVMAREQTFDILRSYLTVVAVLEGETTVSVQTTYESLEGKIYPDTADEKPIPVMAKGDTRIFKMKQYDVLNIETNKPGGDPTGSVVLANQRVAVFGGSEAANAPNTAQCVNIGGDGWGVCVWDQATPCKHLMHCVDAGFNTCCADHLEHQLMPLKTWGVSYIAAKSWDRGLEKDVWRIMAAEDNTTILTVPKQATSIPVLHRGEHFELESREDFEIHSTDPDKPIFVGRFLAAEDAPNPNVGGQAEAHDAGTGDPAFSIAIPVAQFRSDFVFFVPEAYEDNYVSIIAPSEAEVTLDEEIIDPALFKPIGSGTFAVYRARLKTTGTHLVTSTEPAGVDVYGYDQYVSYAYPAGMDLVELKKENPFE